MLTFCLCDCSRRYENGLSCGFSNANKAKVRSSSHNTSGISSPASDRRLCANDNASSILPTLYNGKCLIRGYYLPKWFFHNTLKYTYKRWNSILHQTYFFNTYLISSISCSCCKWKNKWRSLSNKSGCNWLTNCVASCMRPFCMASRISMRSSNELSSTEGSRRPASIWNFSAASLKPSTSN